MLAGAADRDVSKFRGELRDFRQAVSSSFNALREDMVDLRTEMNDRFARVDDGFAEVRGKLDAAAAGQQKIVDLLQTLIGRNGT